MDAFEKIKFVVTGLAEVLTFVDVIANDGVFQLVPCKPSYLLNALVFGLRYREDFRSTLTQGVSKLVSRVIEDFGFKERESSLRVEKLR